MKYSILLIFMLFQNITASTQTTGKSYPVLLKNNGFIGTLGISSNKKDSFITVRGDTQIIMKPAIGTNGEISYYLNTGCTVEQSINPFKNSFIFITFDDDGKITKFIPEESAVTDQDGKTIILKTSKVRINTGKYDREWHPSWGSIYGIDRNYYHDTTLYLINHMCYTIGFQGDNIINCESVDPFSSYIAFNVFNEKVEMWDIYKPSASVEAHAIKFKTRKVMIDPKELSDKDNGVVYIPKFKEGLIEVKQKKKFYFIRNVLSVVECERKNGNNKRFYFVPM